jgi:hypothetical protein
MGTARAVHPVVTPTGDESERTSRARSGSTVPSPTLAGRGQVYLSNDAIGNA